MAGGFEVDVIAEADQRLLAKYHEYVRVDPSSSSEASHAYAITILRGRRNPEKCQMVLPIPPDPPKPLYPPPGGLFPEKAKDHPGPLRTCRLLDNGVHVHQYGEQGGTYTLRLIEVGDQEG